MIKEIKISNYRGLSSEFVINFEANSKNRRKKDKYGVTTVNKKDILLSVALMGKNGSGKTSFVDGIDFLNALCVGSVYKSHFEFLKTKLEREEKDKEINLAEISRERVLNSIIEIEFNNYQKPIEFFATFIDNKNEVNLNVIFSPEGLITEKIIENGRVTLNESFLIENYVSKFFDTKINKVPFVKINPFWEYLRLESLINFKGRKDETSLMSKEKLLFLNWIRIADEKIIDIVIDDYGNKDLYKIMGYDREVKNIGLKKLSSGTQKWINIFFPILDALIRKQLFIFFDEIERSFHPKLVSFILKLFNDKDINIKKSQILFTTHTPELVDSPFRKDAVNFIDEAGTIVNIAKEFNVREDLSISKNYYSEKLAAHPDTSEMANFIGEIIDAQ